MYKLIILLTVFFINTISFCFANDVYAWFYSCNVKSNTYLLNNSIISGVYPWCNNYLYNKWQWNIPDSKKLHDVVDQFHEHNIKVYPSITNSPTWDFKAFFRNDTTQNRLINFLMNESDVFNLDGYNLDLEYGDFDNDDKKLYSDFVLNLMNKLEKKNKKLSICIGNLKNGNIVSSKFDNSNLLILDMATYTSDLKDFFIESVDLSSYNKSNIGIGLSAATSIWKQKPNKTDLDYRFYIIDKFKFNTISLFGNNWFHIYEPYLYKFKNK